MPATVERQMKDEKNIDNIIRQKLEGFSAQPPAHIWGNVQRQLAAQKRKTRLMYIGSISAAAVVVLAFMAGWYFNGNSAIEVNTKAANEIIQPEKNTIENDVQTTETASQNTIRQSTNKSEVSNNKDTGSLITASSSSSQTETSKQAKISQSAASSEQVNIAKMESADVRLAQNKLPNKTLAVKSKGLPADYLTENEKFLVAENIKNINSPDKPNNNWKMGMFVAPGYSSYNASHSEGYSKNMTYSGSDGNSNVGGGFSVQYKTSKRWIVESGVYYAQNGQESETSINFFAMNKDVEYGLAPNNSPYFANVVQVQNNKMEMNSTAGVIAFSGAPKGAELSADFDASKSDIKNLYVPNGSFSQVFEFMEIPLFVRYRLVDTKFGVEFITGLNAGIVVSNNAYIDNKYGKQNIGETEDISPVNLSGTLGVGLNYALGKHFAVAVEPRFNYYLNSINTNSAVEFRPYRIGFYTGVSYEF